MKVVILTAGIGRRLGQDIPKALVVVENNITILDIQLKNLTRYIKPSDVIGVVGFKKNLIMQNYPHLNYAENENFINTNTAKSLLISLDRIINEDVLYMNGDVIFDQSILETIFSNTSYNLVCVNKNKVGEEEIKYTIDKNGFIKDISKQVKNAMGEAVGINFIKKDNLQVFKACLDLCKDSDYHERAIELAIKKGINFLPLNIGNRFCIEIDYEEDLKLAKTLWEKYKS